MAIEGFKSLNSILKEAFGLLLLDGGLVVAIHIATFFIAYFTLSQQGDPSLGSFQPDPNLIIVLFGLALVEAINFSAILYRLFLLKKGVSHLVRDCYLQAIKRLPMLFLLNILTSILIVFLFVVYAKVLAGLQGHMEQTQWLMAGKVGFFVILFLIFFMMPYLLCVHVVAEKRNALQAFSETFHLVRYKIPGTVLAVIASMYSVLAFVVLILDTSFLGPIVPLIAGLCFIYCHAVSLVLYDKVTTKDTTSSNDEVLVV